MAEPIETLYIELQGRLDGLERTLKQAEQRLAQAGQDGGEAFSKGFGSGVEQVITKIGSIGAIVAGGAIGLGAFDGLVRSVFSLAQEADRANTQAQLLAATLERNGISATAAEQSFRATADALGVLPQQLNESSKLLINYGATLDQVAKLQEIGGASALAAGRSAAEGADLIAQAITTENSALLNGIGIASNLSTAYQNYGKEVGKTVEQLTAQEKAQAAVNYLLKETQSEVEALPTLLGGLAGQQSKLNNEFKQLQLTLGEALIPAVTGAIRVLNQLLDNLPTVISVATTLAAIIGAQRLAGSFAVLNLSVTQGVSALASWAATTVTTTTVTAGLNTALNALKTFFLTSPAVIIAAGAALITFAQQASAAIAAAEKAAQASDQAFNKTESSRISALRTSSSEIDQLKGRIAALQAALSSIRLGELGGDAEATAAKIKALRGELAALQAEQAKQNTAQATSNDLFKEARTLVENLQKAQDSLSARQIFAAQQAIEAFTKANKDGSAVISAVRAAIAEQNAQLKENEKSTKAATKAVSEWDNYLKSERLEAYRRGLEGMTEAQLRQEVANQRSSRAIEQLQAATARLNEIQTRRIELERQLAAQAANAPLEQSLAKLDRQYNLGTISAQQYLDAVNALLQAFSKQFASATKGSEEYDRLRGIILRLRDVQESLKDTLEETALAFQRQQAAIPLQGTINALADAYKAAEITATEYKNAVDSLLRSESTKFATLEKGTTAYDDQRQVILQLRDIQADLISQLEQEARLRSEVQKAVIDQANSLRILSESGQESFIQNVAQQYVELSNLLGSGQVNARAAELADNLSRSLSSVQIDEGTRATIKALLQDFIEVKKQFDETVSGFGRDVPLPTSFFEIGNALELINIALDANDELSKNSATSNRELADSYGEQAQQLQDIRSNLLAQLAIQRENNASTEEQATTLRQIAESNRLIDRVSASIDKLRDSYDDASAASRLLQDAFEAGFDVPGVYNNIGNAVDQLSTQLENARVLTEQQILPAEQLADLYRQQLPTLEAIQSALRNQAEALSGNDAAAGQLTQTLQSLGNVDALINSLNQQLTKIAPSSRALRIAQEATDDWGISLEQLTYGIKQSQNAFEAAFDVPAIYANVGDSIAALRDQFGVLDSQLKRGSITNQQYSLGIQSLINLYGDLEQALIQQGDALQSAGDSAGALSQYNLAEQANQQIITLTQSLQKLQEVSARKFAPDLQVVDLEAGIAGIVEQTNALDAAFQKTGEDIFGTADAIRANINILGEWVQIRQEELNILEQQGNRGSDEYNKTAASLQRAQAELNKMRDVLDGYNRGIRELLTLDLPAEFNVLSSVITDAEQQLAALAIELGNGTISGEEYRQTLFAIATQIDSLVTALNEQRDAIQVVDEASQSAYGNLTTILQQASAALANTTEALRANAAAAIEAGRALRILQETSNEDVTQQVREGLRRLEELLSAGVINDEVLQLSDQLSELAGQTLPPDVRQWFERLMQDLSDVRGFIAANTAETTAYSNANRDLASNIAKTVDALRRSGERIVTLQDALDALKKYEIQVDTKQLEELRNFLFLTRTDFEDFVQASIDAAKDLPKLELINFSDGLANIGRSLETLQQVYQQTGERGDDYRQGLIDTIGDLQTFISVVGQLARQYSAAAEESDRALGAELTQLVEKARTRVEELSNQLNMLGVDVLVVDDLVQGFDRLDRTLARVQLPDILPDAALRNLLTAAGIDFGNFQQLGAALNNIPAPLRASSTLFGDFSDLVELSAQAQNRLAEAAGLALSQNQQLANQIRILAQELVVTGAISTDVALQYLELANQIGNTADNAKSGIDPFKALSSLTFQNFRELSISLDRLINPLTESSNAADLLQSALREAANAERLLSGAAAAVDNQFTRQAETIREYAAQLENTGQVAPDLIARLRDLARALDIQAPLEEGRKKTEQLKNELLEAVDAFAGFGNLDIAGFDGLVSLSQGIAKLIGGDILGGIQSILAPYADLLEPILRPLGGAFSDLLDSLNPMISALGELLNSAITPLVQIASSVLLPVFEALGAAIKVISDGIKFLFDGLVSIYNATVGQLFGQIGDFTDASGLIQRIEDVVGKIGDAAKEAIIEMSRTVQETLASSFASALSDGIFEAISTGDLDTAKKALEERLKQIVVQVIIDTAVKAALATAAVSEVLKNLSDAIAYAIATGDWSGVGDAVTKAVSTVTGIMQQLSQQLTPVLGGLIPPPSQQPPGQGANPSLPNPFAAQQLPLSPQITVPLLDSAKLVGTAGTQISDASTALVEGLQGLELDSVASDMARSSRDFRAAVDDLGALLSNRTNWAGVNSR